MRDTELLQMALGLAPPWQVSEAEFDPDEKRLDIRLDFPKGSTFTCPACGQIGLKAYDTTEKTWRHLNFFQHEAYPPNMDRKIDDICQNWKNSEIDKKLLSKCNDNKFSCF